MFGRFRSRTVRLYAVGQAPDDLVLFYVPGDNLAHPPELPAYHRVSIDSLTVNRRIKAAAIRAGFDVTVWRTLTGHSMRVGAAQDLMCAGRDILVIMTAGGWISMNVVGRCAREAQLNVWE